MSGPRVTVLLPVYNGARYLRTAVQSILRQTYRDYELLIVDDGSRDESAAVIASFADQRIRLIRHESNVGLVDTLNEGINEARGEYIARMDADDISLPGRLAAQARFLDARAEVGIVGTRGLLFGGRAIRRMWHPVGPQRIRCELLFDTALIHPSVMLRKSLLARHGLLYEHYRHAEDLALWQSAADRFAIDNLPHAHLLFRAHATGVTGSEGNQATIRASLASIDRKHLGRLGIAATDKDLAIHHAVRKRQAADLSAAETWLLRLETANGSAARYPADVLHDVIRRHWYFVCRTGRDGDAASRWQRYAGSPILRGAATTGASRLMFLARAR